MEQEPQTCKVNKIEFKFCDEASEAGTIDVNATSYIQCNQVPSALIIGRLEPQNQQVPSKQSGAQRTVKYPAYSHHVPMRRTIKYPAAAADKYGLYPLTGCK